MQKLQIKKKPFALEPLVSKSKIYSNGTPVFRKHRHNATIGEIRLAKKPPRQMMRNMSRADYPPYIKDKLDTS